jgi:hypothetical protein
MEIVVSARRDRASSGIRSPEMSSKITPGMLKTAATGNFPLIDLGDYVERAAGSRNVSHRSCATRSRISVF